MYFLSLLSYTLFFLSLPHAAAAKSFCLCVCLWTVPPISLSLWCGVSFPNHPKTNHLLSSPTTTTTSTPAATTTLVCFLSAGQLVGNSRPDALWSPCFWLGQVWLIASLEIVRKIAGQTFPASPPVPLPPSSSTSQISEWAVPNPSSSSPLPCPFNLLLFVHLPPRVLGCLFLTS